PSAVRTRKGTDSRVWTSVANLSLLSAAFEDVEGKHGRDEDVRGVDDLGDAQVGGDAAEDVRRVAAQPADELQVVDQLEERAARVRSRAAFVPSSATGIPVVANDARCRTAGVSKAGNRGSQRGLLRTSTRTVTAPAISIALMQTSPSPCA